MQNQYDVVIIGAGNGGLISACRLALFGKKVLLLEQHNIPGGFATSFRRGRFEFEASLHELCEFGSAEKPGQVRQLFNELGITDKVKWIELNEAFRCMTLDGKTDYILPLGREAFIKKVEGYLPNTTPYLLDFFNLADEIQRALEHTSSQRGNVDTKVLKENYPNYMRTAAHTVKDVFEKGLKMPQELIHLLSGYWIYLSGDISELNFAHYAMMLLGYIDDCAYVPTNRSHEISLAIEERIRELGGEIWYNSKVERIITEKGEVTGVTLSTGKEIKTNHVICNFSPHLAYHTMIKEPIPKEALQLANARKLSYKGFCVYLGMNKSPEELGFTNHSYFLFNTLDSTKENQTLYTMDKNKAHATVCLNKVIPDCSPKGTSILYITGLYLGDTWEDIKAEDYEKMKNKIAKQYIETFEKRTNIEILPYIEEIEIATPMTFARYTGTPNGTIYGYHSLPWDGLMSRTMTLGQENFIKGLKFCGGFAYRLSGYSSAYVSGDIIGKLTMLDLGKEGKEQ